MYACIYELWKNCCGRTGRVGKSKVLQEVLADLKTLWVWKGYDRMYAMIFLVLLKHFALGLSSLIFIIVPTLMSL